MTATQTAHWPPRRTAALPWVLAGGVAVLISAEIALWVVGVTDPLTADVVLFPVAYLAFATVGALILSRRPGHRIGQLGLAAGIGGAVVGFLDAWARIEAIVPGQHWAAWFATWGFWASLAPIMFVLHFPDGRLPGPRWRLVAWIVIAGTALVCIGQAFTPGLADHPRWTNPVGIAAFRGSLLEEGGVGWLLAVAGLGGSGLAVVARLRRAEGVERAQLKWIALAGALLAAATLVMAPDLGAISEAAKIGQFIALAFIPIAAGIAILRYRLYDIDLVIRRTLVYGGVVAILGSVYVALVLALQAVLAGLTGGETLPVAVSTLAIAALFGPVRARARAFVDRRFYRSRYDAQRTLEGFSSRLRDEVELEAVSRGLVVAANEAVRPASVGLWIRGPRGAGTP